ncbi:BTAD domain-containing putative transcriptional regulator [Streptomyces sp. B1866]|uniref:AfsR/SARP family transcriptional regulator n=1 Tax=Streptomyces sp. B1866 TaxID=3075431 RepID=UPI00288EBE1E|nr:BTAD domain-containing putative transcriptional regulator [Streptomyces sp. B1866]MDT3397363.1 BTAD domain-containing putative transcriptional regulator [Streptomyces sp. B1866]
MRYGILGTTQAHRGDGTLVPLGGARLRALLAALALDPGRVRTAGALIGEVWADEPPADGGGALQALVGRLRRVLGRDAVRSAPGGYRLAADPDDVDLFRFERLVDEGASALADGDPAKAAAALDDALALWRGPALADLPDAAAPAARAEALRLTAYAASAEADLALGRAERTLPVLAELCRDHPLDEALLALRIRALRDSGRTAEALAAYESGRAELADRLGADPGPGLRALHAELLRPVPATAAASAGGGPSDFRPPEGVRAQGAAAPGGAERGVAAGGGPASGRVRSGAPPGNLRARLTSFVGRETDLAVLRADLVAHRLVTLTGAGGAGKTRLSQEAADAVAARWPDGVWLAELAPVDEPGTVPEAVLTALGARQTVLSATSEALRAATDPEGSDALARLAEHCAPRRMLLVLDNCEHVVDAAARLADFLLARCPGVTVLATSREPLAVPGEVVRPVEPLPDPVALRLLGERGAAARPGFRTGGDPEACAEICRRLDGLPLAIELAAARLRMLTPRQIADRLDDRFRLLTGGHRTVLPRQKTLRAVVDWSWDLLDEPERTVLRRLSVFAGGCDLALAEAVCADGPPGAPGSTGADGPTGVDARDVAALLGSLVDKSLVVAAPADGDEMRYRLLETVAEYAAERLAEAGERAAAERRHVVAYRELARAADPLLRGPGQRTWLARLEREHDNLRAALRRAVAAREEQDALCLVLSLSWFWQLRGHRGDARQWSAAAAALGPDPFAPPVVPAEPLAVALTQVAPPYPPDVLAEARRGVRLVGLANIEGDMGRRDSPEARRELAGIVAAYQPGLPQTVRIPGVMWFYAVLLTGDFTGLRQVVDTAVDTARGLGGGWELGFALLLRAKILNDRSDRAGGVHRDADECLRVFTEIGDAWGVAEALSERGWAREQRGVHDLAAEDYRAAVRLAEELGARAQVWLLRTRLASVSIESGTDPDGGERVLREVVALEGRMGGEAVTYARIQLAMRCGATGRTAEARAHLDYLLRLFGNRALGLFEGLVGGLLAWLDGLDGAYGRALSRVREALAKTDDPITRMVAPHLPLAQLLTGARALAGLGGQERAAAAARLVGAYDALWPPGYYALASERRNRAAAEAAARSVLGDAAYERARAEGGGLTLSQAAALL